MWSPSFRRASRSLWRPWSPRAGVLGPRTAAVTFAVLEVLSLRKPLSQLLARARPRTRNGLAFATLGGATLSFLKGNLRRRNRRSRPWGPRAKQSLREPVEAALAMAMLSALAMPFMSASSPEPAARKGPAPRPTPPGQDPCARSIHDAGDNGDELDFDAAIASW
ncbi:hypothetical protein [Pyxidicoccus trucidator]|uniref:hypothetical protein n=1 Tax=Pyxidicoccus trucidator TaxID=2709662 RepID=UPI0013D9D618|nr:hypothetical protein [Pyxidicoccus trucidator]